MSYPHDGPYPVFPGQAMPPIKPPKPPRPSSVDNAFRLMLTGAGLTVLGVALAFAQLNQLRATFQDQLTSDPALATQSVDTIMRIFVIGAVLVGAIETGLWTWMAFANRSGAHWARITGTVFFGIDALSSGISLASATFGASTASTSGLYASTSTVTGIVLGVVTLVLGLITVILMWNKDSNAYYRPPLMMAPYAYGYPYPTAPYPTQPPLGGNPTSPQ